MHSTSTAEDAPLPLGEELRAQADGPVGDLLNRHSRRVPLELMAVVDAVVEQLLGCTGDQRLVRDHGHGQRSFSLRV
jgi:hypothetical protein